MEHKPQAVEEQQEHDHPFDEPYDPSCIAEAAPKQPKRKNTPRVPVAYADVNVNFCKNPSCPNFGIPVEMESKRGRGANNRYTVVASGKGLPDARCNTCNEQFPLKSNQGIFEEAWRLTKETFPEPSCPEVDCENHRRGISTEGAYYAFGTTKSGSKRYRCRAEGCGKTFSVKPDDFDPTARRKLDKDPTLAIFKQLVNKMPLRRIREVEMISGKVLYDRIDFIYRQALAFLAHYEGRLPEMSIRRLAVGVDRQEYACNWKKRETKANVILHAVAATDNFTGYCFGMHTNFDHEIDPDWVETVAKRTGDGALPAPHRKFARLWLRQDFARAAAESVRKKSGWTLTDDISCQYQYAEKKANVESSEFIDNDKDLPKSGVLVHSEYTLYGAFMRFERLFAKAEKVRFYLDQDSGMRAACLAAFERRIKDREVDAFYVRIEKELTVDAKRRLIAASKKLFKEYAERHPEMDDDEVKTLMLMEQIRAAREIGKWKDRWVAHPLPTMSEPDKASCMLTDLGDYELEHLAKLHRRVSLHQTDSFFNRIRRHCTMLERPVISASVGRSYYAYSAYRPEHIQKLLTILRACHNFVWTPPDLKKSEKKTTPAMRLQLADRVMTYEDILNFRAG